MDNAYHRKKQPEVVRRTLLDCTARLAAEHGLASVTIQAIADAAGVTKGGLFHHFPNKQALVEAVCHDLMNQFDHEIEEHLRKDEGGRGRFTRAYVRTMFADRALGSKSPSAALSMSMITDPHSKLLWETWIGERMSRHAETDSGTLFEAVRLAADGAWLAHALKFEEGSASKDAALLEQLIALTRLTPT